MMKAAFGKRKELLKRKMNRELKKRIVKTVIWSVTSYAAETWTLRKGDEAHQRSGDVVDEENGKNELDREKD